MRRNNALVLIASTFAACGGEGGRSAGDAAVIESTAPQWTEQTAWRLGTVPLLTIGRSDGPAEYELFRINAAYRLADKRIVIANGSTTELRFYDATGRHLRSVGRTGAGPGEFRALVFLERYGRDSLVVWDAPLNRGTVFDNQGNYGRNIAAPGLRGFVYYLDAFSDRALLGMKPGGDEDVVVEAVALVARQQQWKVGVRTHSAMIFRLSPEGAVDSIRRLLTGQSYYSSSETMTDMPFGRRAAFAALGDSLIHYGSAEAFEIQTYTLDGVLVRTARVARPNEPLTEERIDAFVQDRLGRMKDPAVHAQMQRFYAEVPFPETLPAFSDFIVDAESNLWINDYRELRQAQPRWTVLDPGGKLLGTLMVPESFQIRDIGRDYVLGTTVDEFDVERVVLYRLVKPAAVD